MKTSALSRIALATGIAALAVGAVPVTAQADDGTTGKRKTLPVLVEFSDSTFEDAAAVQASTPETYFGTKKDSLASFFTEVSRGQYTTVPAVPEKFVSVKLPMSAGGCDHGEMNSQTQKALEAKGLVRGEDYESLSMVFPAQKAGCDWAGLGSVPGPYTWINLAGTDSGLPVTGHEFGHNLGFAHQGRSMCTDGDLVNCKDNGTSAKSIMGGGGPAAGFSSPEMIHAGWLSKAEAVKVTKSGTYKLRSLHGGGSGTRALDIAMGEDRLVVEYRHEAGSFDKTIEGVHAYRVPEGNYGKASLVDLTEENQTTGGEAPADADAVKSLTDKANKVSVAVTSSGDGKASLKVALDGKSLSSVADDEKAAAPNPKHTGSDTDAGDGLEKGTEVDGGASKPVDEAGSGKDDKDLAATGGSSMTVPVAIGGAALVLVGGGAIVAAQRRKRS